ncbi:hypothetical protein CLF_100215 [Clonorchis sinensis]|uniref:Uncharacterized protein n=1 Tax=Clonorchis sinensis TaxID=79923 RepID=H2KNI6_CLOSI|nr:hypothetical protein CLF_100215 [Clonorchis sinensis]
MSHSRSRNRKHSRRTSSSSSSSYDSHESDCSKPRRRGCGKNRRNEVKESGSSTRHARRTQRGNILHKLAKRVYRMVDEDNRKHIDSKRPSLENTVPPCGCPLNCGAELQKLRDYVNRLHPLLSESNQDTLQQLECFCDIPERLLLEAWTIIGAQKLKELLTDDLLVICARREKRDSKHHQTNSEWPLPPFTSFDELHSNPQPVCGITELWRRSLTELRQLSTEQVKWVLSGSPNANFIALHWDESSKLAAGTTQDDCASNKDTHLDSTSQLNPTNKEADELEMRARAIRSLVNAETM